MKKTYISNLSINKN